MERLTLHTAATLLSVCLFCPLGAYAVDCTWTGAADSSWQTAGNWDCNLVPGPADRATLSTNATIDLDADVTVEELTMTTGTLDGSSDLAVSDQLTWSGGTMSGSGTLAVMTGATATFTGSKTLNRTLSNDGTLDWTGGMTLGTSAAIHNTSNGLFRMLGDLSLGTFGGSQVFTNEGTFIKASGFSNGFVETVFNSTGTVEVTSGVLWFRNNATFDGALTVTNGEVTFRNGSQTLESGLAVNAARLSYVNDSVTVNTTSYTVGETVVSGATVTFNGASYSFDSLTMSGGTLDGDADIDIVNQFAWSGGILRGNGTLTIPAGVTAEWTSSKTLGRVLENAGTINWSGGLLFESNGTITNRPTGEFRMNGDHTLGSFGGASVFTNEGMFVKSSGFSNGFIETVFNSTGTVAVQSGVLWFRNQASLDGELTAATAEVSLRNGNQILEVGLQVNVDTLSFVNDTVDVEATDYNVDETNIAGATVNFNGADFSFPTLTVSSGTMQGDVNFTVVNNLNWSNGTIQGAGDLLLPPGASATLSASPQLNRRLENQGTVAMTGSLRMGGNGAVSNEPAGEFNMMGDLSIGSFGSGNTFDNAGQFAKSAGQSNGFMEPIFTNSGTVDVQSGALWFRNNANLAGTISAPTAEVRFSNGVQTFSDQLNLSAEVVSFTGATATVNANTFTVTHFSQSAGTVTVDAPLITVLGDFVKTGGTLNANAGVLSFAGGGEHDLTVNQPTEFNDLMVGAGDILVETVVNDNVTVAGLIVNDGIIRKRKATSFAGSFTFGLTGVSVDVRTLAFLSEIEVNRMDTVHPTSDYRTQHATRYWTIVPTGDDSILDVTLPHTFDQRHEDALVCRLDLLWRCGRAGSDSVEVTTTDLEDLPTLPWTVGDYDIILEDRLEGDLLPVGTIDQLD